MTDPIIAAPAGFVPAIAFGARGAAAVPVDPAHPLPTCAVTPAAQSAPLTGAASASATVGPFVPEAGRPIVLTLAGSWTGSVTLLRSIDGGATQAALTVGGQPWASFTGNVNEPIWTESEAAATFFLALTVASGTISYRVAQ